MRKIGRTLTTMDILNQLIGSHIVAMNARSVSGLQMLESHPDAMGAAKQLVEAGLTDATGALDSGATSKGVAVIQVAGTLVRRHSWLSRVLGATEIGAVEAAVKQATADPRCSGIVLCIDSAGGTVFGTPETANAIRDARKVKPTVAFSDAQCLSGAYWLASNCDAFFMTQSAVAGSIGVVAVHVDHSGADAMKGRRVTEITAGKYKRIAGQHAPLAEAGRAYLQGQVDQYYEQFVESVATGRGVSVDRVLSTMADGRDFIGAQAVTAGLADGIGSLEEAVGAVINQRFNTKGRR